ncbi:hypothetical protein Tco_1098627 [Tanacetum coccineum]
MENEKPRHTLGDYSKPSHEGYRNTIEVPDGNNVVSLRSDTIRLVQNGCSFHGLRSEDPNQHLKDFLKLMDSLDLNGSISTWEDLTNCFLAQIFPPGRTSKLRNDILMFQLNISAKHGLVSMTYSKKSLIMALIFGSKSKSFMTMSIPSQDKPSIKRPVKSLRDFHKTHPSGSGTVTKTAPSAVKIKPFVTNEGTGVKLGVLDVTKEESSESEAESWGNDKDDSNNDHDSSGEDSDQENDSDDDKTQSDNENESDSKHETNENESGYESYQEENEEDIGDDKEEVKDEFVKTLSNSYPNP